MGYRKVWFRIRSQYDGRYGWPSETARQTFQEETRHLLQDAGWTLHESRGSGVCDTATLGKQDLYIHPMALSGVIDEDSIPKIEELLSQAQTFHCYHVDRYEEYLDMTDSEYKEMLESQKESITADILEAFKTKRRDLFKTGPVLDSIAKKYSVNRLCDQHKENDFAYELVQNIHAVLLDEGKLVMASTSKGLGYRTATAKELREQQQQREGMSFQGMKM